MFETLLSQNVCVYVIALCGFLGVLGRALVSSYLKSLIRGTDSMGHTKKKSLANLRKRYEDVSALDVDIKDVATFVDKYIDRLKIGCVPVNVWNGCVKNFGLAAGGTGIFAAVYQYYVVGDGKETLKMLVCGFSACIAVWAAYNQWDVSWHMKTLGDCVKNYLVNSPAVRNRKEDRKQIAATEDVSDCRVDQDLKKMRDDHKKKRSKADPDYDELLDKMMQKILADG